MRAVAVVSRNGIVDDEVVVGAVVVDVAGEARGW
jgi:hypothetical protein